MIGGERFQHIMGGAITLWVILASIKKKKSKVMKQKGEILDMVLETMVIR